jgi:GTP-binding protein
VKYGLDTFVIADIPGLIEGAHKGMGLGHQFLKHVERAQILLYLLSCEPDHHPVRDFEILHNELQQYKTELTKKPALVAVNMPFVPISCITREGIKEILNLLAETVLAK